MIIFGRKYCSVFKVFQVPNRGCGALVGIHYTGAYRVYAVYLLASLCWMIYKMILKNKYVSETQPKHREGGDRLGQG